MGQLCCCVQINHPKVGIKEIRGKFNKMLQPGVHYVNWCVGQKVKKVNLRLHQVIVKCLAKTKDNVFLTVTASVQYQIIPDMANSAFYSLLNPKLQIQSFIMDSITSTVPMMDVEDVFAKRRIVQEAQIYLNKMLSPYGLKIICVLILNIYPEKSLSEMIGSGSSFQTGSIRSSVQGVGASVFNEMLHRVDKILALLKSEDTMLQQLSDIQECSAQLSGCQISVEQWLQVATESLSTMAHLERQKTEIFIQILNTLTSSIAAGS
ncbi:hypothetical protein KP509_12G036400 [Ceratopteris richardii]|uniref:Band 7 domain-containing protein n=1 Tax=Ceratopteris richardii TaxID=49495 RepID=A0A8T2TKT2_CERRI|nr:hypothetical protein KP509_12G036400 [Ceratopteris richardii]KAH7423027.1 hypothetical protein KP509_12G036400 [Ceratopteris richardii]KAH7423028.1 hypothetical protein KP509_12G036400 [Ceratopteris richardii]KAH7423029.1 hypothetical protein KP509_12G036400 [Ceratopteris richardii]KAH7423030.1 hypothetical protein KP509_12G036400 [Ceratopteris richardii]